MIGKAAGYYKWFNGAGADMIKLKAPQVESGNHYVNNPPGTVVTPEMVMAQISKYDQPERRGHLYGAIIASLKNYIKDKKGGKYAEYQLALCLHYEGDLSQPLHNVVYDDFNRRNHAAFDGIVNDEILDNIIRIRLYPIKVDSVAALAKEIARIATLSLNLGYEFEKENRLLTKEEAYQQLGHSASLFKAILEYVNAPK
jgi:hypothetical protein